MAISDLLARLRGSPRFMSTVATWRTLPARPPRYASLPARLHPALHRALAARGIDRLYAHQHDAVEAALNGDSVVVVTPTASGKTLCYNLPVLHALLNNPDARALYLFPTKALAHDQLDELQHLAGLLAAEQATPLLAPTIAAYDGDTPSGARNQIRRRARLILTNPDMLHVGILPYHMQWAEFLAGLCWIIVDEMHTYRGVFGSHIANVLRRLQRICRHYGGEVRFICTSATIGNPAQLAERLIEQPVTLVDYSGAPQGEKHVVLVNPPLIDPQKGIRRAATLEAVDLATACLDAGVQTIVFGRSRLTTELMLTYLREKQQRRQRQHWTPDDWESEGAAVEPLPAHALRGYRGGYLPSERRAIEVGLRSGEVRGVVATNALELGIDIGGLEAVILCGYPGSIASMWQQMGRAGRTTGTALAILVATGGLLDQYTIQHAEFLFECSPEHARIDADNLMLLVDHVRCAAFELPFQRGEPFGASRHVGDVLDLLAEEQTIYAQGDRLFWSGENYPARHVSLRRMGGGAVVIQRSGDTPTLMGEVDQASAQRLVHDGAIYLHEGQSYLVKRLDRAALQADVVAVEVDYYTEAITEANIERRSVHAQREAMHSAAAYGEVVVYSQVIGYRRIKRMSHETLGVHPLEYPRQILETNAYWCEVVPSVQRALEQAGLWFDSINDYGPNWRVQRARVRARDRYCCASCGAPEPHSCEHDVHHKIPFRAFGYVPGLNDRYLEANHLDNLMLLCRACHRRLETAGWLHTGLDGLGYVLSHLAPLHLMCDRADLGAYVERGAAIGRRTGAEPAAPPLQSKPSPDGNPDCGASAAPESPANDGTSAVPRIYIFERIPAGLGFSAFLYEMHTELLESAYQLVAACACAHGCPACVGPVLEGQIVRLETKQLTLALLRELTGS